jgi:malonyl CoA-acyl carrier protein transacylase
MSSTSASGHSLGGAISAPIVSANVRTVALLASVAFLALLAYYFIGLDEGMSSVFGNHMGVHEFFHDGRHLLGFPCH